jgi:hypothetical protein
MSFDPHSRRLDPCRLFLAIETIEEEIFEALDASRFSSDEESTNDPTERPGGDWPDVGTA